MGLHNNGHTVVFGFTQTWLNLSKFTWFPPSNLKVTFCKKLCVILCLLRSLVEF